MRRFLWTSAVLAASLVGAFGWSSSADAWSSRNTPEYAAEVEAAGKVPGGYKVRDANMRSTKKSISIMTYNAKGKQVNFECPVTKQTYRDGSIRYFTGTPQLAGS